jgi:hypothetical protein
MTITRHPGGHLVSGGRYFITTLQLILMHVRYRSILKGAMRLLGTVFILLGLVFCATIAGAAVGILMILVGAVLVGAGRKRKMVINNSVTVVNNLPEGLIYQSNYKPQRREPVEDVRLPPIITSTAIAAPVDAYDKRKWQSLVRYDDDLCAAVDAVRGFGPIWEDELAVEYLSINDKTYLPKIIERIVSNATAAAERSASEAASRSFSSFGRNR